MFGNLISPNAAMSLLRAAIEKELKFKVPCYEMVFEPSKKSIKFFIPIDDKVRVYPYENSAKLCAIVESMAKDHIKKGEQIDVLKLQHNDKTVIADIYYQNSEGKKFHLNKTL